MSDRSTASPRVRHAVFAPRRDAGMTLPELLISMVVLGLVVAVLSAGITVTLRSNEDTRGRVDVARWEQNLGMWLPDDLTSAQVLTKAPGDTPCGASATSCGSPAIALAGSNVLFVSWSEADVDTQVSYLYQPDGAVWGLFRVVCTGANCAISRVLSDLAAPPSTWTAGTDPAPPEIIDVNVPPAIVNPDPDAEPPVRQVSVTVNGQQLPDGTDRSSRVTLAASGEPTGPLEPPTFTPPSFGEARSECGGPITLIVDTSGSIGGAIGQVRDGVKEFVNLFEGTPTRLQIIPFSNVSTVIMPEEVASRPEGAPFNYYYDMSEPGIADEINFEVDKLTTIWYTNWEDAIYRTLHTSTGVKHADSGNPSVPQPELVVFFTDGLPTRDRASAGDGVSPSYKSDSVSATREVKSAELPFQYRESVTVTPGSTHEFSPRGYFRANYYVDLAGVRMIGVGVGPEFDESRTVHLRTGSGGVGDLADGWTSTPTEHEQILGNLVRTGQPYQTPADYRGTAYTVREWSTTYEWGDVSNADVLVSSDFTKFASALTAIALDNCGGTLTVQTRYQADRLSAGFDLEYEVEGTAVTTTRASKSGTFDIDLEGGVSRTVRLSPQPADLAAAEDIGYRGVAWECRAAGEDLAEGTDFTLVDTADPGVGIHVTVRANAAVSCTLLVAPA